MELDAPDLCASASGWPKLADQLRALRALGAVARHGSTMRAAEAIHLSQPAVARAVLELERICGMALFTRGPRGMAPTALGAQLAGRAETLFLHLTTGAAEALACAAPSDCRPKPPERFPAVVRPAQLRALLAIAEHGTEACAAAAIGISQPAVHAGLQSLENALGARLAWRLAAGTQLAPAGEALLRRAKLAMAEVRAMQTDLAAWRGELRGRIVIGVLPLSVPMFLPRAVQTLLASHRNVEIQIVDGTYESLLRQLMSAEIDVLAGALRPDGVPGEVRQLHLFYDELVVVAPQGHPCLADEPRSLADLLQHEWVVPLPATPAARALDEAFRAQGLPPPSGGLQASSPALTLAFVLQTGRLAVASRGQALLDDHGGRLRIVPVPLPTSQRRIGVATRAVGEPSLDLGAFLDACRSVAGMGDPQSASQAASAWETASGRSIVVM